MLKSCLLFSVLILFAIHPAIAEDTGNIKTVKVLPLPAFGYSPETSTYIGAVSLFTFNFNKDSISRQSNAKIEFNYTWRKQVILDCGWNLFSENEAWFSKGQIVYSRFPDLYYGIGTATADAGRVTYNSNRFMFDVSILKQIRFKIFTGINLKYTAYWKVRPLNSDTLYYTELRSCQSYGIGYAVLKDSRNNILTPLKGMYTNIAATCNFSEHRYLKLTLDLRSYKTWNDKYTMAARIINDFTLGDPPFFDYSVLGGDKFVRGYYFGRYRDKNLSSLQTEFRLPLFRRFGLAVFGGVSRLYPDLQRLIVSSSMFNGGLGLRFVVDKTDKTSLRIDYALGSKNNNGFYVSFGESF